MTSLAIEIEYQFACRYVAIMEKMLSKHKASNPLVYISFYDDDVFWGLLTQNVSPEYIRRHPEKPWDKNPVKPCDRFHCSWSFYLYPLELKHQSTLEEIEADNKRINDIMAEEPVSGSHNIVNIHHIHQWLNTSACNKNLTLEFLEKYWDKDFNLFYLAANPMKVGKLKYKKEYMAALKIQEMFLQAKYNPDYAYCRKLHSEFYQSLIC